jgi:flagellar basal body-associated protein FliL
VLRIQADIRLKKKEAIAEAKRKQRKMIENIIIGVCLIVFLGVIGAIIYLVINVK